MEFQQQMNTWNTEVDYEMCHPLQQSDSSEEKNEPSVSHAFSNSTVQINLKKKQCGKGENTVSWHII